MKLIVPQIDPEARKRSRSVIAEFAPEYRPILSLYLWGRPHMEILHHLTAEAARQRGEDTTLPRLLAEFDRKYLEAFPPPEPVAPIVTPAPTPIPREPAVPKSPRPLRGPDVVIAEDGALGLLVGKSGKRVWFDGDQRWTLEYKWRVNEGRIVDQFKHVPTKRLTGMGVTIPIDGDIYNLRVANLRVRPYAPKKGHAANIP